MALGPQAWRQTRALLQDLVDGKLAYSHDSAGLFVPMSELKMLLPVAIGDYTDFYASKEHATNVGCMFRGKENALMPNWYHSFCAESLQIV
jgi:fumarylacetoacetase